MRRSERRVIVGLIQQVVTLTLSPQREQVVSRVRSSGTQQRIRWDQTPADFKSLAISESTPYYILYLFAEFAYSSSLCLSQALVFAKSAGLIKSICLWIKSAVVLSAVRISAGMNN